MIEATLAERVDRTELLNERFKSKRLINVAVRRGLLTAKSARQARATRQAGNSASHNKTEPTDEMTWGLLIDTRVVVEEVFSKS